MQQITLTAPELDDFSYAPGQDVMLLVAADGKRPVRRRYTIRSLDRAGAVLTMNIVRHGEGPGERWVREARAGDRVEGIGPRGKITTSPGADWHLFLGDESALPAIFAMTESLPGDADATLVVEVPGPADEQELLAPARTRLSWLHRLGRPATPRCSPARPPRSSCLQATGTSTSSARHSVVSAIRDTLAGRGLTQTRSRRRPTGAAAGQTPATASPPETNARLYRICLHDSQGDLPFSPSAATMFHTGLYNRTGPPRRSEGRAGEVASAVAAEMSALLSGTSAQTLTLGIDGEGRILQHDRGAADILADKPGALLGTNLAELIIGPGEPAALLQRADRGNPCGQGKHHRAHDPHRQPVGSRRRRNRRADQVHPA